MTQKIDDNTQILYTTVGSASPQHIDNSVLLVNRGLQTTLSACVIISICNIVEALYWQQTGKRIKFKYDDIYKQLSANNMGINFAALPQLFDIFKQQKIAHVDTALIYSKNICKSVNDFKRVLFGAIHKYQFATIGCQSTQHALTICGYTPDAAIVQTTYAESDRFVHIKHQHLYTDFIELRCITANAIH